VALANLPERLDDRQLQLCDDVAALPVPAIPAAPNDHFLRCIRTLTLLPSRADDQLTGELRVALYRKHFGHLPAEALSFLVERATLECKFFPTPAECKAIIDRWNRADGPWRAHQLAEFRAREERQARFDDLMRRLRLGTVEQEEVDQLPERWKQIAACQGHLWEGTYQLRRSSAWGREQEGQSPTVVDEQHTREGGKAPSRHERNDQ
jgi:hypothetical protein